MTGTREELGQLVRYTWMQWAAAQPDAKPSWLVPWEDLDERDREVDRRIGEAVARHAASVIADLLAVRSQSYPAAMSHPEPRRAWRRHFETAARVAAGAFTTREELLREAAQAIERGDFVACDIPEETP